MEVMVGKTGFWRGRSVLVTGGAGFIGFALSRALADQGARVTVLDIKRALPQKDPRIAFVRGSVASAKVVEALLEKQKIRTIFHLAAEAIVQEVNVDPVRALDSNVRGTWTVLEAVRKLGVVEEIVVASSDKAYGAQKKLPYKEDTPLMGLNPYDASKSCEDLIAHMYAKSYRLPIAIARCGNVYGPGDPHVERLVPDALRCAFAGETLQVRSDGTFRRDYVYIDDIVAAYLTLATQLRAKKLFGEAFNFGNNTPLSVLQALAEMKKALGVPLAYTIVNAATHEIRDQYLDSRKAHKVLGWRARSSFRDGIAKSAEWYKDFFAHTRCS